MTQKLQYRKLIAADSWHEIFLAKITCYGKTIINSCGWTQAHVALLLFIISLAYTLPGLGKLEFFRHTEADRVLIGWEMLQSKDFLRPHLLGDAYYTKPPVFYALLAAAFGITGDNSEFVARSVSALAASMLIVIQYLLLCSAGWQRQRALLVSAILLTSAHFFHYARVAEIDMTFTLFNSTAIFAGYLSCTKSQRFTWMALAYISLLIAFLTKGPPALVFFGSAIGCYLLRQTYQQAPGARLRFLIKRCYQHAFASFVVIFFITAWMSSLAETTSWDQVVIRFQQEIVQRFINDESASLRARGPLYYVGSILGGLLPWSAFALWALLARLRRAAVPLRAFSTSERELAWFSLMGVSLPFILFSISSGKASRYLFPIYPLAAVLIGLALITIVGTNTERNLIKATRILLALFILCIPVFAWGFWQWLSPIGVLSTIALMTIPTLLAWRWGRSNNWMRYRAPYLGSCCAILLSIHFIQVYWYAPWRNKQHSVKPVALAIQQYVPKSSPLYVLEMVDRWIPYYLIRDGYTILRLTPQLAEELRMTADRGERLYVLINKDLEGWRYQQISSADPTARSIATLSSSRANFEILEVDSRYAQAFQPKRIYPTSVSTGPLTIPPTVH